ncbi:hypothetical protein CA601_22325 [Paraburkholderia hospita]|nr:hypothetical protein CA603_31870 [Paraburkholderia hospita]OUL86286.1 hypothetical protein CA601_22325 [Paraburkholderia hospita]
MAAWIINVLVRTGALAASTLAYHQEGYRQEGGERKTPATRKAPAKRATPAASRKAPAKKAPGRSAAVTALPATGGSVGSTTGR